MNPSTVRDTLMSLASQAVELARRLGADQAEAGASHDEGLSVTVRMGELESVERQRDRGLAVTVYKDARKGTASTSDFSTAALEQTVRKALSIASFTAQDEFAGLADAELMAVNPPDLDLHHPWELDVDAAAALALRAENAARGADPRIANSEGATIATSQGVTAYANSHGFVGGYPTSSHSSSCSVVAKDAEGLERDYWYSVARVPNALAAPESIGEEAARRAVRRLGARQLRTRAAPVLFPPELARGLFGHLVAAVRGASQYRRASFLLEARGKQIFSSGVDIEEDPHLPRAMASAPFDAEGVATSRRTLVRGGVLEGYVLSSYSARRLNMTTTANAGGIHNLIVRPTGGDLEAIAAERDEVFVIGELLGQGANTVTGDYSRGAAGFWLERGEVIHPVNEVTIAGNLVEMFKHVAAVGSDVDTRGAVRCGSVLIEEMTIAGS
jgi:PmbA protein